MIQNKITWSPLKSLRICHFSDFFENFGKIFAPLTTGLITLKSTFKIFYQIFSYLHFEFLKFACCALCQIALQCAQHDISEYSRANIFLLDTISFKDNQVLVSIINFWPAGFKTGTIWTGPEQFGTITRRQRTRR